MLQRQKLKIIEKPVFILNGEILNFLDDFLYLGIIFMSNGSFSENMIKLLGKGRKAMYSMLRKCRSSGLPIDIQLKMVDTMVSPILLYACEVWGYENNDAVESLFYNFTKLYFVLKNLLIVFYDGD